MMSKGLRRETRRRFNKRKMIVSLTLTIIKKKGMKKNMLGRKKEMMKIFRKKKRKKKMKMKVMKKVKISLISKNNRSLKKYPIWTL